MQKKKISNYYVLFCSQIIYKYDDGKYKVKIAMTDFAQSQDVHNPKIGT